MRSPVLRPTHSRAAVGEWSMWARQTGAVTQVLTLTILQPHARSRTPLSVAPRPWCTQFKALSRRRRHGRVHGGSH